MSQTPPNPAPEPVRIDPTFRNGSITAIGVVTAFSLGFLSNWATQRGPWNTFDVVAVVLIATGIAMEIRALAGLLAVASLRRPAYERLVRIFLLGFSVVAAGVTVAICDDVLAVIEADIHAIGRGAPQ